MTGLSLATCDRAFAPGGDAPQWVHLLSEGMETFAEIIKEADAAFPPDRRTSISAISRWWRANRL